jgi:hypothetical protein
MKPGALRIERLLAKIEAELARSARPRRYCFYFDEEAEAKALALHTRTQAIEPRGMGEEILRGRRGKFELIERLFPLSVLYINRLLHQAVAWPRA